MHASVLAALQSWQTEIGPFIKGRRVFAIIDPAVEARFGLIPQLRAPEHKAHVIQHHDFSPNPTWESLNTAFALAEDIDVVLAIGGGTAMDLAKLVVISRELGGPDPLWQALKDGNGFEQRAKTQLMLIPTTAGTGSEATQFAVIYRDGIKYSVTGPALLPNQIALDPDLLTSLPPGVIADAGLDATCQAMESLWSVRSTPESEDEAWAGLSLATDSLTRATREQDRESLATMLVAANKAGKAINLTTTTAPHAFSYGLTAKFGIPHGRAVAILFGSVYRSTWEHGLAQCVHPGGIGWLRTRLENMATHWQCEPDDFPDAWSTYIRSLLPENWAPPSLSNAEIEELLKTVNAKRLANHPCSFTEEQVREIYSALG